MLPIIFFNDIFLNSQWDLNIPFINNKYINRKGE